MNYLSSKTRSHDIVSVSREAKMESREVDDYLHYSDEAYPAEDSDVGGEAALA